MKGEVTKERTLRQGEVCEVPGKHEKKEKNAKHQFYVNELIQWFIIINQGTDVSEVCACVLLGTNQLNLKKGTVRMTRKWQLNTVDSSRAGGRYRKTNQKATL